jgi:hypothetical protein
MLCRSVRLKKGLKVFSVVGIDVERRNGESHRDRDRRVLTALMQKNLGKVNHVSGVDLTYTR